jgi:hypothetical protein
MKERPILFSDAMVRALLDGTKTQTRRIVKDTGMYAVDASVHGNETAARELTNLATNCCPYGQPGDRLWVKETHAPMGDMQSPTSCWYRSDREYPQVKKWRPSIFMRRECSRINLEILSVRVERLQSISDADAITEGIERVPDNFGNGPAYRDYTMAYPEDTSEWFNNPIRSFQSLWELINGAESWSANPWVWVVEFKMIAP